MVEVASHIALVALYMCLSKRRLLGERLCAIAHAVALDVSFGSHVDAIFVAELIPVRIIWIVACADCIEVELLEELDVLKHTLA